MTAIVLINIGLAICLILAVAGVALILFSADDGSCGGLLFGLFLVGGFGWGFISLLQTLSVLEGLS